MVDSTSFRDLLLRDNAAATSGVGQSTVAKTDTQKKNDALGKSEFLNLLVTQLKNQDPMDPMKNDQFAVNLAQFSQLEQLISINDKVGKTSADLSSMAAYLGHEVTLNSDIASVNNHDGGLVKFNLGQDASNLTLELVDPISGSVQESIDVGPMGAGKHTLALSNIQTESGEYQIKVRGVSTAGGQFETPAHVGGLVSGFIPGPEPKLLINNGEVDPADVIEVNVPSQA